MKTTFACLTALTVSLLVAVPASAQIVVSPWGGLGVRVGAPAVSVPPVVRSVYTGGSVSRVGRVGIGPRLGPRWMRNHVVAPQVLTTPQVIVGGRHVTSSGRGANNTDFRGDWRVYASHVNATMTLTGSGYGLTSPGHREVGAWSWHGANNLLGGNQFVLKLNSSQGRSTTFQGQWLVPGREFQMTSLQSGLTYTVVRAY